MKSITPHLSILVLFVGTLASGLMYGKMTNRWGAQAAQQAAEVRLRQPLPDRVGNWQLRGGERKLEKYVSDMLECSSYIRRVYENVQTGDFVSVVVLVGPVGPIAAHTPEICYSSRDYTLGGKRQKTEFVDAKGNRHSLWEVGLRSNALDGKSQRVYWGWSTGTSWNATSDPRFALAGAPYLYKLQLAGPEQPDSGPAGFNPSQDFLSQFLVQCQTRLLALSSSPP